MASNTFGQKTFTPTAPEKGSFPLDHEGECKKPMLHYMICLRQHSNNNAECRSLAKDYLDCRMNHRLMIREDWNKLGFGDLIAENKQ